MKTMTSSGQPTVVAYAPIAQAIVGLRATGTYLRQWALLVRLLQPLSASVRNQAMETSRRLVRESAVAALQTFGVLPPQAAAQQVGAGVALCLQRLQQSLDTWCAANGVQLSALSCALVELPSAPEGLDLSGLLDSRDSLTVYELLCAYAAEQVKDVAPGGSQLAWSDGVLFTAEADAGVSLTPGDFVAHDLGLNGEGALQAVLRLLEYLRVSRTAPELQVTSAALEAAGLERALVTQLSLASGRLRIRVSTGARLGLPRYNIAASSYFGAGLVAAADALMHPGIPGGMPEIPQDGLFQVLPTDMAALVDAVLERANVLTALQLDKLPKVQRNDAKRSMLGALENVKGLRDRVVQICQARANQQPASWAIAAEACLKELAREVTNAELVVETQDSFTNKSNRLYEAPYAGLPRDKDIYAALFFILRMARQGQEKWAPGTSIPELIGTFKPIKVAETVEVIGKLTLPVFVGNLPIKEQLPDF